MSDIDTDQELTDAIDNIINCANESTSIAMEHEQTRRMYKHFLEHPEHVVDTLLRTITRVQNVEEEISTLKAMIALLLLRRREDLEE